MRGARAALGLALTGALLASLTLPPTSAADTDNRLRLDRAIAEPSHLPGFVRLRLFATAVTLQGAYIPLAGDKAFALKIGSSKKSIPYLTGAFQGAADPVGVAIVVLVDFDYADNLAEIKTRLAGFLDKLPKDSQVSVVSYTDAVHASRLTSPSGAKRRIEELEADAAPTENVLVKAVGRAVTVLDRMKLEAPATSARKFVVLVSDGKDLDPEPKRYRKAGERAAKKGIRIHSIAFSPHDERLPLLGLGELSKRSFGTFRWVRDKGLFGGQFDALAAEVGRQYILTFFVKPEDIDKKKVSLLAADVSSNTLRVDVGCGEETCSGDQYCFDARCITRRSGGNTSIVVWVLLIVGGLVGLVLVLALLGFLMSRRGRQPMPGQPMPGQPMPGQPMPGQPMPGQPADASESMRIMAVDSQGRAVGGGMAPGATASRPSAHVATASAPTAPTGQPMLHIVAGPNPGHQIPVHHGMTIGTHPSCQLALVGDGFASAVHAQILMDTAGNCSIIDKGSTNGTFVNGVRSTRRVLAHGNSIKIGAAELRFLLQ